MTWTAAVIGCGRIGSAYDEAAGAGRSLGAATHPCPNPSGEPLTHAGAYAAHPAVRLVGGVDPDPTRRAAFTGRWGAPAFDSIDALLRVARPQLWSICTPPEAHFAAARRAADEGAEAVWCEKPLAPTLAEGLRLVDACLLKGVPLCVNFTRRFDAAHQSLARRLHAGEWGPVERVVVHYARGLANYGSHAVDLLRWWLADEIVSVHAIDELEEGGADPSLTVLARTRRGVPIALLPTRREAYDSFEVDLWARHGRLTLTHAGHALRLHRVGPSPHEAEPAVLLEEPAPAWTGLRGTARAAVDALIAHLTQATPLPCDGVDGLRAAAVVEAARASCAQGGAWTDVPAVLGRAEFGVRAFA
jgi:predicted dehydrogenase